MFELVQEIAPIASIKVIGVGGCGGNAVDHMIGNGVQRRGIHRLQYRPASTETQYGTDPAATGRGADPWSGRWRQPDVGRDAAMEDRERIADAIRGADMVVHHRRHGWWHRHWRCAGGGSG